MERQNRLLTILATLLLVLVAVAVFGKKPDEDASADPDAAPERKLFDFQADSVQSLTLTNPSGTVTFEKADGTWKMTAPKQIAVEERRVTEILDRLSSLKVREKGFEGPLKDFGLDDTERSSVEIGTGDGKKLDLFVGRDSPVGYRSYVAEKSDGPALLASSKIGDLVQRTPDDFRSKDVWKIAAGSAHRVRIENAGQAVVLRKDDHGWWIGDNGPRADADAVEQWLSKAGMLRVDSFEDAGDPAALGLATPASTITIEDDAGTHVLKLGNRDDKGVEAATDGAPIRLGTDAIELVHLDGWTAAKLMPVRRAQVDTIDLQLGDKTARLTKTDETWKDATGATSTKADALLDAVDAAKADRTAPDVALGATWGHVTLAEGTTRNETVTIGQELPGGARAAKDDAGGPPFQIPAESVAALVAAAP